MKTPFPPDTARLPRVILHSAVSADGRIDGHVPDIGLYYGLAAKFEEDATLGGSETLLRAPGQGTDADVAAGGPGAEPVPAAAGEPDDRPLLVLVDSRGRVRNLAWWRSQSYWRDIVVLASRATPRDYLDYLKSLRIEALIHGDNKTDLRAGLEALAFRYGVRAVRVDSGGTLNGVLLRQGLVDEFSLLVSPALVGGTSPRSSFRAPDLETPAGAIPLRLVYLEKFDGGSVWLRYEVVK
jgi:2,5-diamino-6-(ribosylamino)-4(3H)-pyrimidinone 5'-phosphate reductase